MNAYWMDRRVFLTSTGTIGLARLATPLTARSADVSDASRVVLGKDKRLIVHTPGVAVLETPPGLLDGHITPLDVLFVRNNQQPSGTATLNPMPLQGWSIELNGLLDGARTVDAATLTNLDQVEQEMVLQCSGNGRSLFAQTVKAKGTQWTRGGMGNIRVAGVRLSTLLDKLQVRVHKSVRFVTAEGADSPDAGKEDFEHSLPIDDVLQHSLLALTFNGEPIPAIHGGPVRLMTPGYFGTMHVKWLSRLRFECGETTNYNQIPRYRTPRQSIDPGTPIEYTFGNSRASWRMKVKSVVLWPLPGETIVANKRHTVRGVAFNDGAARIDTVLTSIDRGQTWTRARLEIPKSPYAWCRWTRPLALPRGEHQIWTRAVDALGRSQPINGAVHWNPSGYEWNGVEKITIRAT